MNGSGRPVFFTVSLSSKKIEEIRGRMDIVRVIGAYVSLKKKGRHYLGLCPFHAEKTPSFSVTPEKNLFYCFGCHVGGDAFAFLMRHLGIDFVTAVRKVATEVGVDLEPESQAQQLQRKRTEHLAHVNAEALAFFEHALWHDKDNPARIYLKKRKIPEQVARRAKLGFGGQPTQLTNALRQKGLSTDDMEQAGLLSEGKQHVLCEGRLVFPIEDSMGRIAGFGARLVREGTGPKYVNSRETPLFSKRRLLYGLTIAQTAIRKTGRCILVEGYMDVLACQQTGFLEAVAPLGTALSQEHAQLCASLTKEVLLFFDGDNAGKMAMQKSCIKLFAANLRVLVANLDRGQDPDSLLHTKGTKALQDVLGNARPAMEHFVEEAFAQHHSSIEERANASMPLLDILAAFPRSLEKDLYEARIAEKVGVSVQQLRNHIRPLASKTKQKQELPNRTHKQPVPSVEPFDVNMLRDLLLYPSLRSRLNELSEYASDWIRPLLEELSVSAQTVDEVIAKHVVDPRLRMRLSIAPMQAAPSYDGTGRANKTNMTDMQDNGDEADDAKASRTFDDVLCRLKARHIALTRQALLKELKDAEDNQQPTEELEMRLRKLIRLEQELKRPGHKTSTA